MVNFKNCFEIYGSFTFVIWHLTVELVKVFEIVLKNYQYKLKCTYVQTYHHFYILYQLRIGITISRQHWMMKKKVREKSRECHNHIPQPFPDTKRKRKPKILNKHKSNKRTKSTKISSLFPKQGNRNAKRTAKHKNKMTQGKT